MPNEAIPYPLASMQSAETVAVQTSAKISMPVDPTTWVDEHGDYLFRYAVVRLRDEAVAEDCVQETFLSAIKAIDSYGGKSTEKTWLTGILKHKIIDHFRQSVREKPISEEETDLSAFDVFFNRDGRWKGHWHDDFEPTDWRVSPETVFQETEFFKVLQRCLSKLPERVASVFTLREMDGLETAEICELLSLTTSNFWVMMHRARMGLRRCVELNWFKKA
jgi:RNA polymerase sigma-70 factor, ECF subfamily